MDVHELRKKIKNGEVSAISLTIENHPNCPKCGSSNTKLRHYEITDYIHRHQTSPLCKDCGYSGIIGFESIHWGCAMINGKICFTKEDVTE